MEALSRMLSALVVNRVITGFSIGTPNRGIINISHLLFADDTLIMCEADQRQVQALKALLFCFEAVSGLKVNLDKSELVPIGLVPNSLLLARTLGCKIASFPLTYLGLPLGSASRASSIWDTVIEKIERRLAGWKRMYLSKGGRITLIKSTLSNLPTYFLSLFPIPASVATCIEKLQRDFLWGGLGDEFKFHLVKWKQVCRSIPGGGLGVRNLRVFNRALLGKWLWRFAREPDSLWKLVIEKKYGSLWGEWCTREVSGAHGVGLWKHIRRGWEVFNRFVKLQVGTGTMIKFWSDVWCDSRALKDLYPSLFQLASVKDLSVADAMEVSGGRITWIINFGRAVQDWEISSIADFYSFIYSIRVNNQQEDVMW
ncbi:hypothetical protein I3843_13G094100 [Carya illinoinensis]|nr:hypothetical protein I3843_13G094100 [Carya illinoinensis]